MSISTRVAVAAIPAASAWAARSKDARATGSPARAAAATAAAEASPSGPGCQPSSRARRAMFGPLAIRSTQPRAPHGQGSPSRSTLMWPMCRRCRWGPGAAAAEDQAAADARGDHHAQGVVVTAGRTLPVLGRRHGDSVADQRRRAARRSTARTRSTSGKSRQPGTLTGLTVPAEASTGPALPMPIAAARSQSGRRRRARPSTCLDGAHHRLTVLLGGRGALRAHEKPAARRPPGRRRSWCRRCPARRRGRCASVWDLRMGAGCAGPRD